MELFSIKIRCTFQLVSTPLEEGDNEDYLKRLEKAMDEHGIILQRYQRLSEVVYCL